MAVINMLPIGDASIEIVYKYLEDGVLDTSLPCGDLLTYAETNGKNNKSTMEADGYLHLWGTSSNYGMSRVYTQNYFPKGTYDYALVHIIDYSILHNTYPIVFGGSTTRNATQIPIYSTTSISTAQTGVWHACPLTTMNSDATEMYWGFGGSIDVKIDKIYFVKVTE